MKKILFLLSLFLFSRLYAFQEPNSLPVVAKQGMVVSEQHLASQIGIDILKKGGNAFDAAVAVGYALSVVTPCCGNIGGGGFMTLHFANGKNIFVNFREKAPLAAKPDMFLNKNGKIIPSLSTVGYLAVATPGTVMGFETVLKKYGTMTREQVMAPAITLAEKGYILTAGDIKLLSFGDEDFAKYPNVAAIFLNKKHKPFKEGDRLIQKNLAETLKLISKNGPDVFYKGKIAQEIVSASKTNGGILSLNDFSEYKVQELTPLSCTFRKYTIISAPPPSSGGTTLCEMLNILENYPLKSYGFHSSKSIHYITEAMRYAFFDRNSHLGDPDFVRNPVSQLISKDHAAHIVQDILDIRATPSNEIGDKIGSHEGINTTHYSIVDKKGNAASVTFTLNSFFGAKVIAGDTGFFLNNEMDDFTAKPGEKNKFGLIHGEKNRIQPGKRPLSSMTPTLIFQKKKLVMVLGSPGGPRIITSTLQAILNNLVYGMNIKESVDAPRFHHQWLPDTIYVEPDAVSALVKEELISMGYHFTPQPTWSVVEAIVIDPDKKTYQGANDRRRMAGKAIGY